MNRWLGVVLVVTVVLVSSCGSDDSCLCSPGSEALAVGGRCLFVDDYDVAPVVVRSVAPIYPEEARLHGDEGTIYLRVGVGSDGRVCSAAVESTTTPAVSLQVASLTAIVQWKWRPAIRGTDSVAAYVPMPLHFVLHHTL